MLGLSQQPEPHTLCRGTVLREMLLSHLAQAVLLLTSELGGGKLRAALPSPGVVLKSFSCQPGACSSAGLEP